jgi:hypothetical protein|tara:strand:+ start:5427 stop:5849 length:423 start_codon:yes stop_codon:yes gene_type:complete
VSTTAYYQSVSIAALSLSKQNYDATASDFLPFEVTNYADNAGSDANELTITFPLGTLQQTDIENLITKGSAVVVSGTNGTQTFWTFTGRVTDAEFNLIAVALTVGSPLRPISSGVQLPGVVPFRVLTTANAGKLPLTGRN